VCIRLCLAVSATKFIVFLSLCVTIDSYLGTSPRRLGPLLDRAEVASGRSLSAWRNSEFLDSAPAKGIMNSVLYLRMASGRSLSAWRNSEFLDSAPAKGIMNSVLYLRMAYRH
jgi:hypothetical protein